MMFFATQVLETITAECRAPDSDGAGADRGRQPGPVSDHVVCSQIPALFTCANRLRRRRERGRRSPARLAVSSPGRWQLGTSSPPSQYSPGSAGSIVVVKLVLSMAAVRHRAWLQHGDHGEQQQAGAYGRGGSTMHAHSPCRGDRAVLEGRLQGPAPRLRAAVGCQSVARSNKAGSSRFGGARTPRSSRSMAKPGRRAERVDAFIRA